MEKREEPPDDGRKWVRVDEAVKRVGLCLDHFRRVVKRWELTTYRAHGGAPSWYLEEEIESWAEWKRLKRRWHIKYRPSGQPRVTEAISLEDARRLCITTEEAAKILGVTPKRVRDMVRRGKLVCYQHRPRQPGSQLWFSRRGIEYLHEDLEYQKWREVYKKRQEQGRPRKETPKPEWSKPLHRGTLPHGWLTTRQTAERLGVCPQRVLQMRAVGRLRGEQLWRNGRPLKGWYFLEGDVEALKADPLYQEVRQRYLTANSPERLEAREAERLKKLVKWTLHVNGWDDPWHTFTYQAAPDGGW